MNKIKIDFIHSFGSQIYNFNNFCPSKTAKKIRKIQHYIYSYNNNDILKKKDAKHIEYPLQSGEKLHFYNYVFI